MIATTAATRDSWARHGTIAYARSHGTKSGRLTGRPRLHIDLVALRDAVTEMADKPRRGHRSIAEIARRFGVSRHATNQRTLEPEPVHVVGKQFREVAIDHLSPAHRTHQWDDTIRSRVAPVGPVGRRKRAVANFVLPKCQVCLRGDLVPLSDFGNQGADVRYKAWVCTNPECGFNIKIRNGDVYLNEPINDGAAYAARNR